MSKEEKGILDIIDRVLGRVSDSDGANGARRRSWGATVLLLCSMPLVFFVLTTGIAQVILAVSHVPRIPKPILEAYKRCIDKAEKTSDLRFCVPPKAVTPTASKILDAGQWPWVGVLVMFLSGVFFALLRRTQDFSRFKEAAQTLSVFVTKGQVPPLEVVEVFKATAQKLGASQALPTKEPPAPSSKLEGVER